jgi:hypothetical protein
MIGGGTKIDDGKGLLVVDLTFSGDGAFSWLSVPGGVVFFLCPLVTGGGGGWVGVGRLLSTGDDDGFKFFVDSFGSDAARVFTGGNCVVITTGLVVLFERDVGIGGAFGTLSDEDFAVGFGGGLFVTLKILF